MQTECEREKVAEKQYLKDSALPFHDLSDPLLLCSCLLLVLVYSFFLESREEKKEVHQLKGRNTKITFDLAYL